MMALQTHAKRADNVRIGPISVITLIAVISMAVLAVLAASTANATMTISQRQADATKEMYLNETAAQEFVASVDDALAKVRSGKDATAASGASAVEAALDSICESARLASGGEVAVTASVDGTRVTAEFVGEKMRRLSIGIVVGDDATIRIEKWKAAAVQQDAQTVGNLWMGA